LLISGEVDAGTNQRHDLLDLKDGSRRGRRPGEEELEENIAV